MSTEPEQRTSSDRVGLGFIIAAVLSAVAALALFVAAIWTYGPNSSRMAHTGLLAMFLAPALALAGVCVWDVGR